MATIFDVSDCFLSKESMTPKKLQGISIVHGYFVVCRIDGEHQTNAQ